MIIKSNVHYVYNMCARPFLGPPESVCTASSKLITLHSHVLAKPPSFAEVHVSACHVSVPAAQYLTKSIMLLCFAGESSLFAHVYTTHIHCRP